VGKPMTDGAVRKRARVGGRPATGFVGSARSGVQGGTLVVALPTDLRRHVLGFLALHVFRAMSRVSVAMRRAAADHLAQAQEVWLDDPDPVLATSLAREHLHGLVLLARTARRLRRLAFHRDSTDAWSGRAGDAPFLLAACGRQLLARVDNNRGTLERLDVHDPRVLCPTLLAALVACPRLEHLDLRGAGASAPRIREEVWDCVRAAGLPLRSIDVRCSDSLDDSPSVQLVAQAGYRPSFSAAGLAHRRRRL
jgi:hypothetical protein